MEINDLINANIRPPTILSSEVIQLKSGKENNHRQSREEPQSKLHWVKISTLNLKRVTIRSVP